MLKRFAFIMILVLILGIVGISGCTSSDNTTTPIYNNTTTNAQTIATNDSTTNSTSSVSNSSASATDPGSNVQTSSSSGSYVGNANTHVFHYSSCSYVNRMKEGNKVFFNSRDEAIAAGYRPCKVCNP